MGVLILGKSVYLKIKVMKLAKRQKKTGLNARRVEQGGFTSQKTEKNQKVPRGLYKY